MHQLRYNLGYIDRHMLMPLLRYLIWKLKLILNKHLKTIINGRHLNQHSKDPHQQVNNNIELNQVINLLIVLNEYNIIKYNIISSHY